ncbi:CpsD/CapB family tyrosine-protein kinase [Enterococcus faecalis]|uniref:CpsD/CapB family tyrosine-protein kinase n=1 Tax=Enterococcus faecalis TaxID=1351 RepID=UPI0025B04CD0|nr:CpsD/CapB family tyrosine-protein kinase [Enterococcus faecalis]MDN3185224.1 CpsD/CapB family tyrosine-protein kinase [Enterococcus faecalis]
MKKKYNIFISRLFNPSQQVLLQYTTIKNNLLNKLATKQGKVIMVTYTRNKEKQSEFSINLAVDIALDGYKVLLVDADFQNKLLSKVLFRSYNYGFSDVIFSSECHIDDYVEKSSIENLYFLPVGKGLEEDIQLICRYKNLVNFMEIVKTNFDFIVMDTSSVIQNDEAQTLATKVDACILVIDKMYTSKQEVEDAVDFLSMLNNAEIGTVLME